MLETYIKDFIILSVTFTDKRIFLSTWIPAAHRGSRSPPKLGGAGADAKERKKTIKTSSHKKHSVSDKSSSSSSSTKSADKAANSVEKTVEKTNMAAALATAESVGIDQVGQTTTITSGAQESEVTITAKSAEKEPTAGADPNSS